MADCVLTARAMCWWALLTDSHRRLFLVDRGGYPGEDVIVYTLPVLSMRLDSGVVTAAVAVRSSAVLVVPCWWCPPRAFEGAFVGHGVSCPVTSVGAGGSGPAC